MARSMTSAPIPNYPELRKAEQMSARRGLVLVITGDGKGKTTSALGLLLRARGHGMKVAMFQFVKSPHIRSGESVAAQSLGVEIIAGGAGFTWIGENAEKNRILAGQLWTAAREKIDSGTCDIIILDELTYAFKYGWLTLQEVLDVLKGRPPGLHVVITGRDAPQNLIEFADTAMEIQQIKHHLDRGVKAQPGIEF